MNVVCIRRFGLTISHEKIATFLDIGLKVQLVCLLIKLMLLVYLSGSNLNIVSNHRQMVPFLRPVSNYLYGWTISKKMSTCL